MKPIRIAVALSALLAVTGAARTGFAAGQTFTASLVGREEVPPISTEGKGFFVATLDSTETSVSFFLSYFAMAGTPTVSHLHFAPKGVAGGIMAFLCGGGSRPACPAPGTPVTGTLTAADVVGPTGQLVSAGEFAELVRALRAADVYVNVHSDLAVAGEIRGQIQ